VVWLVFVVLFWPIQTYSPRGATIRYVLDRVDILALVIRLVFAFRGG